MRSTQPRAFVALVLAAFVTFAAGEASAARATNFTVRDITGKYVRLSDFSDRTLLISFWATWCKPCLLELTHLERLYQKYKAKGFVVLAVSIDGPETQAKVRSYVQRYRLSFPVVIDRETTIVNLYNPKHAAPFTLFIKKGKVAGSREGFQVSDLPLIENEIRQRLNE